VHFLGGNISAARRVTTLFMAWKNWSW